MLIATDIHLPFPRSLVYETYRDKLVELVPYMPNVRSIEVKSRQIQKDSILCVNNWEWHGGNEVPAIVKSLLSSNLLSWTEYDTWDESSYVLNWKIETHAFTDAVQCTGQNRFFNKNDKTLIECRGRLEFSPQPIQGIPSFLFKNVVGLVEGFLSQQIEPNLLQMSRGLHQYLEQRDRERVLI